MSHKQRLKKLEKGNDGNKLWVLIGIGRPKNQYHQQQLESKARSEFYASGGDKNAYIAFFPFADFDSGFIGYIKKNEFIAQVMGYTSKGSHPE